MAEFYTQGDMGRERERERETERAHLRVYQLYERPPIRAMTNSAKSGREFQISGIGIQAIGFLAITLLNRRPMHPSIHPSIPPSVRPSIQTDIPTYLPTYLRTYVRIRTYILAYLHTCILAYLHTYILTYIHGSRHECSSGLPVKSR